MRRGTYRKAAKSDEIVKGMSLAFREALALLAIPDREPELTLRAVHAVSQCGLAVLKAKELSEIEQRITALEHALAERKGHRHERQ